MAQTLNISLSGPVAARDDGRLEVANIVEVSYQSGWHMPMHSHDDFLEMVLVRKGSGMMVFNNKKLGTGISDLWVYNQDTLHEESSDSDVPLEVTALSLRGFRIAGMPENHILPKDRIPIIKTGKYFSVVYALFRLIRNCYGEDSCSQMMLESAGLLLTIIQHLAALEELKEPKQRFYPISQNLIAYLDLYYRENIRLKDLEEEFHFSQYYLSHKFKEETGLTIDEYITNRRIGEAGKLLIYTDLSISEIAQKVGYDNLSHFSAAFKKHMGISPGKMKEIHRRYDPQQYLNTSPQDFKNGEEE